MASLRENPGKILSQLTRKCRHWDLRRNIYTHAYFKIFLLIKNFLIQPDVQVPRKPSEEPLCLGKIAVADNKRKEERKIQWQAKSWMLGISRQDFFNKRRCRYPLCIQAFWAFLPTKTLGQTEATGKYVLPGTSLNPSF